MERYTDSINELKAKGVSPLYGEFYDFIDLPLQESFQQFYDFCQDYLDRDDLPFNIKPAKFFYNTNTDLNACAFVKNDFSLVEIFKGTIFHLHDFFFAKQNLFDLDCLLQFKSVTTKRDLNPQEFMFQYSTLYFIYHEVGHLIQRKNGSNDDIEFIIENISSAESELRHVKEHDADWFAANQIAFHLISFLKKVNLSNADAKIEMENLTSLALSSIYMYYINGANQYQEIYYQEKTHPHPSVRLSYIITYLLEALVNQNLPFQLDKTAVLMDAIRIAEIQMKTDDENVVKKMSLQMLTEIGKIEDYINKIRNDSNKATFTTIKVLAEKN